MNFQISKTPNYTHIEVNNEKLDALIAHELKTIFNEMKEGESASVVLQLQHVKYIDSSGLTALLHGSRKCERLVLLSPKGMVMKMLEISQLNQLLEISESLEEAIKLLASEPKKEIVGN